MQETLEADVLVVGGGGAGCRAAIEAHDQGVRVLMIVKGPFGNSGCTLNVGTSTAIGPWSLEGDTTESAMRDLLTHGGFVGNQDLAKILVDESRDRVIEMQGWGVDLARNEDGSVDLHHAAAHSMTRNFRFTSSRTSKHDYGAEPGMAIMDALSEQVMKRGIRVLDETALVYLLTSDGIVVGATALDSRRGNMLAIKAGSTVLATGTYSQIFSPTTVSLHETGDGQAAAYRAGAELIDMESTQFVATSIPYPPGSIFRNALGEEFLGRYGIAEAREVTKEELTFAVWSEVKEGRGTDRETILLDLTAALRDKSLSDALMLLVEENLKQAGSPYDESELADLDPRKTPVHSAPRAHTTIGGIRIDAECATTVSGLFACGGGAGGVYGLARPEGYTSMITLVFGRRAGFFAAQAAAREGGHGLTNAAVSTDTSWLSSTGSGVGPEEIKDALLKATRKYAWVMKDDEGLNRGLAEMQRLTESASMPEKRDAAALLNALEARNMLLTSELMFRCSIERKESRGAFLRTDYPKTDNENWLRNTISKQVDGEVVISSEPVDLKYAKPVPESPAPG